MANFKSAVLFLKIISLFIVQRNFGKINTKLSLWLTEASKNSEKMDLNVAQKSYFYDYHPEISSQEFKS